MEIEIDVYDVLERLDVADLEAELANRGEGTRWAQLAHNTDFQIAVQRGDAHAVLNMVARALRIPSGRAA